ncbi:MAG: DUF2975 domain-containing protein [Ignavibacteria bacterium]|nr:DUF2975 domain-containing protein [Ignavibacteria bacterium]
MKKIITIKWTLIAIIGYILIIGTILLLGVVLYTDGIGLGQFANCFKQVAWCDSMPGIPVLLNWKDSIPNEFYIMVGLLFYSLYNIWKLSRNFMRQKWLIPQNGIILQNLGIIYLFNMLHYKIICFGVYIAFHNNHSFMVVLGGILGLLFNLQTIYGTFVISIGQALIFGAEVKQENDLTV